MSLVCGLARGAGRRLRTGQRVENPAFHSPDTIDCATCHTAHSIVAYVTAPCSERRVTCPLGRFSLAWSRLASRPWSTQDAMREKMLAAA